MCSFTYVCIQVHTKYNKNNNINSKDKVYNRSEGVRKEQKKD